MRQTNEGPLLSTLTAARPSVVSFLPRLPGPGKGETVVASFNVETPVL